MLNVAQIGVGYWGPNLLRNLMVNKECEVIRVVDFSKERLNFVRDLYPSVKLSNRTIGIRQTPLIVAEMSGNHSQSLSRALEITEAAAKAGADILKLQTYSADTLTLPITEGEFLITDEESPWKGENLYNLYEQGHTPWEWHEPIIERANELGLICFSTPFDESAVDFLENLNVPAYKIASFEITHLKQSILQPKSKSFQLM